MLVARLRDGGWPDKWHPDDVIPWVHTEDLAEMTWLAATLPAAAGQTFLAVDRNVAIGDYFTPIITTLGHAVTPPDREPVPSRCRIGKIHAVLGYLPQRTFEQTLKQLLAMAGEHATTHQ
jgi:dihydroflavonol-4-reductase